jgi:uncharacterized protein (TIGR00255 family)
MTGFGRAQFDVEGVHFGVEARSVNHRHLDLRLRLPRVLTACEPAARDRIRAALSRGKVDVTVTTPQEGIGLQRLQIDLATAREYARAAEELARDTGLAGPLSLDALLTLPGVATFGERDLPSAELEAGFFTAVDEVMAALDDMRVREGAALERDLRERLETVLALVDSLADRSDTVREAAADRLRRRAAQLELESGVLDEGRLHQEIVLAVDRMDITEEIVRLRSHVSQFREILEAAGPGSPVGRRLDFLMQEFGREANTIGSKGSDSPIAHQVVELKTEIERMREQVQNVE